MKSENSDIVGEKCIKDDNNKLVFKGGIKGKIKMPSYFVELSLAMNWTIVPSFTFRLCPDKKL